MEQKEFLKKWSILICSTLLTLIFLHFIYNLVFHFHNSLNMFSILGATILISGAIFSLIFIFIFFLLLKAVFIFIANIFTKSKKRPTTPLKEIGSSLSGFFNNLTVFGWIKNSPLPKFVKIINIGAYGIFLVLFILVTMTPSLEQHIEGSYLGVHKTTEIVGGKGSVRTVTTFWLTLQTDQGKKVIAMNLEELGKCNFEQSSRVIVKTHPITYNLPYRNKILSC